MASSLSVAGPEPGRISQILPAVKCSSCNNPVPIAELGEHVCTAPPVMPAASQKPPMSPTSTSFFQAKYQKLISSQTPSTPQATTSALPTMVPPRAASVPPRQGTPLSVRGASPAPPTPTSPQSPPTHSPRQASVASLNLPNPYARPERVPSPLARGPSPGAQDKVVFPSRPESAHPPARAGPSTPTPRAPSPLSPRYNASEPTPAHTPAAPPNRPTTTSEPAPYHAPAQRMLSPGPTSPPATAPPHIQAVPLRAPSVASVRSLRPGSVRSPPPGARQPTHSSPAPFAPPSPQMNLPYANTAPLRPRASTSAQPESDVIYSTARPMMPPQAPPPQAGPSRVPSLNVNVGQPMSPYGHSPSIPVGGVMSPPLAAEIDTKTGGEAGMAGVGRRGFAAAARAAMFAQQMGNYGSPQSEHPPFQSEHPPFSSVQPGLDGRRANAPRYLDIASANQYNPSGTPPLSAGSTASPHSPQSGGSPLSARIPSPHDGKTTPTQPTIARTPSPLDRLVLRDRVLPPPAEPPKAPLPAPPSTPSLPFFEKFKNKIAPFDPSTTPRPDDSPGISPSNPRPPSPNESEFEGLAYADDDEEEEGTVRGSMPPPARGVRFPSIASKRDTMKSESKYSESEGLPSPRLPARSLSTSTTASSYTVRHGAKSTGALERPIAMETLLEQHEGDPTSPTASSVSSPAMFPAALAAEGSVRDSMRPKLPTRAHTSPGLSGRPEGSKRRARTKACLKCEEKIEDGRWIQMEGGGVMCDRCWKHMYLPKCRRCSQTIEKHAVSSSDGQLKGKYHRDCFNCHTCHKPFPDKSFYVFDGKPFCAYHYHEANNSLCAAPTCGEPIEGPCAMSHSGDRFHPEHFLCEYPRCAERLVEYWEVDGRMFCDRHAQGVPRDDDEDSDDEFLMPAHRDSMRATKRKTVFMTLGALGAPAG
ncbi:LIM domain-containing protein [Phanerochaete sordida]|uniref:LIM domain-containing protein n=1 Tax=Phanerochaete sordida TaxID=48140 RepID=A0A9P3G9G1_9APHY|nr:LIM domain-containing protein [Phanerochaete sordida]